MQRLPEICPWLFVITAAFKDVQSCLTRGFLGEKKKSEKWKRNWHRASLQRDPDTRALPASRQEQPGNLRWIKQGGACTEFPQSYGAVLLSRSCDPHCGNTLIHVGVEQISALPEKLAVRRPCPCFGKRARLCLQDWNDSHYPYLEISKGLLCSSVTRPALILRASNLFRLLNSLKCVGGFDSFFGLCSSRISARTIL